MWLSHVSKSLCWSSDFQTVPKFKVCHSWEKSWAALSTFTDSFGGSLTTWKDKIHYWSSQENLNDGCLVHNVKPVPVFVSLLREQQTLKRSSHPSELLWRFDWGSPLSHFSPHWSVKSKVMLEQVEKTQSTEGKAGSIYVQVKNIKKEQETDLTCLSVVVTGFALFFSFKCLFATWKTFFCFLPFCLFFAMSPEERTAIIVRNFTISIVQPWFSYGWCKVVAAALNTLCFKEDIFSLKKSKDGLTLNIFQMNTFSHSIKNNLNIINHTCTVWFNVFYLRSNRSR